MNIGLFVDFQKEKVGGGYVFEQNFIESLKHLHTIHKFFFFYFSNKRLFNDTHNITFVNIPKIKYFKLKDKIFKLHIYLYDIRLMYYYTPAFYPVDLPYIATVWDLNHNDMPAFPEVSRHGGFETRQAHYNRILPKATRIIVGNDTGKKEICKYYPVDESKVKTIPMFTPQDIFNLQPNENILKKYNLQKNSYIYYPAHFWAHKNHIRILKALKELQRRNIYLRCVFSGMGSRLKYIKNKVNEYALENQIIFAGFVTREEVCALYKNALALTYASVFGPDNIPPLESLALGCPVIISNIKGHINQLGNHAIYFDTYNHIDLADKIEYLLNNPLSQDKKIEGEKFAKQLSSDNYVKKALNVIEELSPILECWEYNNILKDLKINNKITNVFNIFFR